MQWKSCSFSAVVVGGSRNPEAVGEACLLPIGNQPQTYGDHKIGRQDEQP
jgi:hypothetical protein